MMVNNVPDKWVVIKITLPEGCSDHRVFGSWIGGYIGCDSWQINSGIKHVTLEGKYFRVTGCSGSTYLCHRDAEGCTSYGGSVLAGFLKDDAVTLVDDGAGFLDGMAENNDECN